MDRPGALAALRRALERFTQAHLPEVLPSWIVALSGGPDSLALTAAAAALRPTEAVIVDHGLQSGSGEVADEARRRALHLGCVEARIIRVEVAAPPKAGGPEAAARRARYTALGKARGGRPVLLGHTLDDQAETVLLGLGRGSGTRSLAGMRPYDPPWARPLLDQRRELTVAVCAEIGLTPWCDPHNTDPRFTRARLRNEVLPLLDDVLGGGVPQALSRTATALRETTELLDALAAPALTAAMIRDGTQTHLDVTRLAPLPEPVRREVIRRWLLAIGAKDLTDRQIRGVSALVTEWRDRGGSRGGVAVGSGRSGMRFFAGRRAAMLTTWHEPV